VPNFWNSTIGNVIFRTDKAGRLRRRTYLVDKQSQYRMAGEFAVVMLVGSLLSLVNVYIINLLSNYSSIGINPIDLLWGVRFSLWACVALLIVVSMAIVFVLSVLLSHRVAGPADKIVKSLESIGEGNLTMHIRLRKKDHLKEIAQALNGTVTNWRGTLQEIDEQVQSLRKRAGQLDEKALMDGLSAIEDVVRRQNLAES